MRRLGNAVIKPLVRSGLITGNYALLTVRGRSTGRLYTTPVRLLERDGQSWLVAPYGAVSWVRNARAAGEVTLRRGRRNWTAAVVECDAQQSGPILRDYVRAVPVTRPYFDARPDDPVDRFVDEATAHPVFRLVEKAST
ncbi:nitroreductase family deazaflavin-dependent oxidoreductase [Actinomadura madurae]|nr:nitroreductase family deazaflavin-dependent oxidoreductase [Actinomadura madurae]MCP9953560.1 nitroreductase family deazaflavin-dependent oxidoreductase [Actinomadura madurae]MCP9970317.1 nitroreductase family deazaflavin-dependent oxidoreductase [Actinomadura madurae]MCP9982794.1 nitroreductase family deazaflavin-dependent oxidoreductase [Actinomadura madurae]MCQ0005657.1 nitroreductase family deazaflavin-dependent oxidoreductase [Actinomadura madurae]MCQ0019029.1 nitroreductase family dea